MWNADTVKELFEQLNNTWIDRTGEALNVEYRECYGNFLYFIEEAEWIIWNGISRGVPTPGAAEMLSCLQETGIRTGVISNLCWSGSALTRRLREAFPKHSFDFILTSSEYIFRKPDKHIFDMAIHKSGLAPNDIWYCGNDIAVDVLGAYSAGLFPVFYDDRSVPSKINEKNDSMTVDIPHLHLSNWRYLMESLIIR